MRTKIVSLFFWVFAASVAAVAQPLFITEFMATQQSVWVDEEGDYLDWVEIYNAGTNAVPLGGWFLTDRTTYDTKSFLPNVTLPPKLFLVVSPSFKLSSGGEFLALTNSACGCSHVVGVFPAQLEDVAYGYPMLGEAVLTNQPTYLQPTPGRRNGSQREPWPLALTEVMYQPISTEPGFQPDERLQFVELKNVGTEPLDLTGYAFIKGIRFAFSNLVLAAGDHVFVVSNRFAFELRYGASPRIAGEFTGNLKNSGENLLLRSPAGELVVDLLYDQTWRPLADGLGFSLVLKDESAAPTNYNRADLWRNSARPGGSPGLPDPALAPPRVVVNEILARAELPYEDVIELANLETNAVDVSGWYLSDRSGNPYKFRIPEGTVIPGGGYLAFDEHAFNPFEQRFSPSSFAFNEYGDEVWLFSADLVGNLTGYAHGFVFGGSETNVTLGRIVTSTGVEQLVPQSAMTFLEPNTPPSPAPLVISEFLYAVRPDLVNLNSHYEYIELHNLTAEPVPLYDLTSSTNRWRLAGAVDFTFPEAVVPPFGRIIISPLNPIFAEPIARFRSSNSIPNDVQIFGPWFGGLSGSGETIQLLRPEVPTIGLVPYRVVDAVRYSDSAPWPSAADGFGASLSRINEHAFGDDPANWRAALPNPGRPLPTGPGPRILGHPSSVLITDAANIAFATATLAITADGAPPLSYQWAFNGKPLWDATRPALTNNIFLPSPQQVGTYSCTVIDRFGSATSSNAAIRLPYFPRDDTTPPSVTVSSPSQTPVFTSSLSIALHGHAADDVSLAGVFIQQDSGPLRLASETTDWTFTASLNQTHTTIRIMALDRAGNISATNLIEVLLPTTPAQISVNGSGSIQGMTNGQVLTVGTRYTVRAVPDPGQLFVHWEDGDGDVVSTSANYSFTAGITVNLTAVFAGNATRFPALIDTIGHGTVQGVTNGQNLKLRSRYTVKARPASGHLFVQWTDGDGRVLSTNPSLTFKGAVNVALTATFVEDTHFLNAQGSYAALFFDPVEPDHQRAGSLQLTARRTGKFTGVVRLGGRRWPFAGGLDTNQFTRLVLSGGTQREMILTLQLNPESAALTGTVSNALVQTTVTGARTLPRVKGTASAWAGTYPLQIINSPVSGPDPAPPLNLTIHSDARFYFRGKLPDGTRVAQRAAITTAGDVPVHGHLHQGKGSLLGWLNLTPAAPTVAASAEGSLLWSRVAHKSQAGFSHRIQLSGSLPPTTNTTSAADTPP